MLTAFKSETSSFHNFKTILNKKSDYLKNLEKRKNKSYRIINKTKNELLKQKLQKSCLIQRNYKIFSKNTIYIPDNYSSKFCFGPNIKPIILSKEESENYPRYKKKEFDIDNFSLIYKTTNSKEYPIRVFNTMKNNKEKKINNKNKQNKNNKNNKSSFDSLMISVGNSVISNNSRYNSSGF